ncbi:MAG: hypothetical protein WKG00_19110, partial [Polyangiaceae bacterium]
MKIRALRCAVVLSAALLAGSACQGEESVPHPQALTSAAPRQDPQGSGSHPERKILCTRQLAG